MLINTGASEVSEHQLGFRTNPSTFPVGNQTWELGKSHFRVQLEYSVLLGATVSLVAKGNRVPGLLPVTTIFVVLVQGLQVGRQDQTSDRHTDQLALALAGP